MRSEEKVGKAAREKMILKYYMGRVAEYLEEEGRYRDQCKQLRIIYNKNYYKREAKSALLGQSIV